MNAGLNRYYHNNVKLNLKDAEKRRDIAFPNVRQILEYVSNKDPRFSKDPVRAGSYWQGLKVEKADEFDYSIVLEGIGPLHWTTSGPRYYNFNKNIDVDHSTVPQHLDVVKTSVPLPSPPKEYSYVSLSPSYFRDKKGWEDVDDMTRQGDPGELDIIPFLVRKLLQRLLSEAKRDLNLRGNIRQLRKVNGPALTMYFTVRSRKIGIDFAPIIRAHLPFPSWIVWPRPGVKWPNPDKIREIKDYGISLVAKKDFWWMMSFAELEKKLVDKVDADGGNRKELHRIMKKLNADVWCNTSKPVISSYVLKNIWFWEMEKHTNSTSWDNNHLWIRLESMTSELLRCIRTGKLDQYFAPEINLLEKKVQKNRDELNIAADKIVHFLRQPLKFLDIK